MTSSPVSFNRGTHIYFSNVQQSPAVSQRATPRAAARAPEAPLTQGQTRAAGDLLSNACNFLEFGFFARIGQMAADALCGMCRR